MAGWCWFSLWLDIQLIRVPINIEQRTQRSLRMLPSPLWDPPLFSKRGETASKWLFFTNWIRFPPLSSSSAVMIRRNSTAHRISSESLRWQLIKFLKSGASLLVSGSIPISPPAVQPTSVLNYKLTSHCVRTIHNRWSC